MKLRDHDSNRADAGSVSGFASLLGEEQEPERAGGGNGSSDDGSPEGAVPGMALMLAALTPPHVQVVPENTSEGADNFLTSLPQGGQDSDRSAAWAFTNVVVLATEQTVTVAPAQTAIQGGAAQPMQAPPVPDRPPLAGASALSSGTDTDGNPVAFEVDVRSAAVSVKPPEAHPESVRAQPAAAVEDSAGNEADEPVSEAPESWFGGLQHGPLTARDRSDRIHSPNEARAAAPVVPKEIPATARLTHMSMMVGGETKDDKPVRVDVAQQGAGIRVTVRCADQGLSTAMTADLSALLNSLAEQEFDATANLPIAAQREALPQTPLVQDGWTYDRRPHHPDDDEAGRRRKRQPSTTWEDFLNGTSL